MKVIDLLVFLGEIRGLDRREAKKRAKDWLERLDLSEWADKRTQDLSKGMQQKVQFIGTVIHEPELLILDEPFSGLDPVNMELMRDTIVRMKRESKSRKSSSISRSNTGKKRMKFRSGWPQ